MRCIYPFLTVFFFFFFCPATALKQLPAVEVCSVLFFVTFIVIIDFFSFSLNEWYSFNIALAHPLHKKIYYVRF